MANFNLITIVHAPFVHVISAESQAFRAGIINLQEASKNELSDALSAINVWLLQKTCKSFGCFSAADAGSSRKGIGKRTKAKAGMK